MFLHSGISCTFFFNTWLSWLWHSPRCTYSLSGHRPVLPCGALTWHSGPLAGRREPHISWRMSVPWRQLGKAAGPQKRCLGSALASSSFSGLVLTDSCGSCGRNATAEVFIFLWKNKTCHFLWLVETIGLVLLPFLACHSLFQ